MAVSLSLSLYIYVIHLFKCGWWLSHPDKNQGSSGKMEAATTMAQAHLGAVEWLQSTLNQPTAHGVARQGPNHSWVFVDLSKCPRWLYVATNATNHPNVNPK